MYSLHRTTVLVVAAASVLMGFGASAAAKSSLGSKVVFASPVPAQPVAEGSYELTFSFNGELILMAHIEDNLGNPAQRGAVVFQYCSYKGLPSDDITQPDEAPSSACENGTADWANLARVRVNSSGNAFLNFGLIRVVNTIGFRYRYVNQGGPIDSKVTDPVDWIR